MFSFQRFLSGVKHMTSHPSCVFRISSLQCKVSKHFSFTKTSTVKMINLKKQLNFVRKIVEIESKSEQPCIEKLDEKELACISREENGW